MRDAAAAAAAAAAAPELVKRHAPLPGEEGEGGGGCHASEVSWRRREGEGGRGRAGTTIGVLVAEGDCLVERIDFDTHEHGSENLLGVALGSSVRRGKRHVRIVLRLRHVANAATNAVLRPSRTIFVLIT